MIAQRSVQVGNYVSVGGALMARWWTFRLASGTTFATLQPDNATGNFTKIVQRLPIKIVLAPNQPRARLLRVGLSVEATIQIP
jgi:membrane fusion protein (multidrug efflux system)